MAGLWRGLPLGRDGARGGARRLAGPLASTASALRQHAAHLELVRGDPAAAAAPAAAAPTRPTWMSGWVSTVATGLSSSGIVFAFVEPRPSGPPAAAYRARPPPRPSARRDRSSSPPPKKRRCMHVVDQGREAGDDGRARARAGVGRHLGDVVEDPDRRDRLHGEGDDPEQEEGVDLRLLAAHGVVGAREAARRPAQRERRRPVAGVHRADDDVMHAEEADDRRAVEQVRDRRRDRRLRRRERRERSNCKTGEEGGLCAERLLWRELCPSRAGGPSRAAGRGGTGARRAPRRACISRTLHQIAAATSASASRVVLFASGLPSSFGATTAAREVSTADGRLRHVDADEHAYLNRPRDDLGRPSARAPSRTRSGRQKSPGRPGGHCAERHSARCWTHRSVLKDTSANCARAYLPNTAMPGHFAPRCPLDQGRTSTDVVEPAPDVAVNAKRAPCASQQVRQRHRYHLQQPGRGRDTSARFH